VPSIRTTHTGSLHRPPALEQLLFEKEEGGAPAGIPDATRDAVAGIVEHQLATGIDIVNDGEMGKVGYSTYVKDRLTGFDGEERSSRRRQRDADDYPDFAELMDKLRGRVRPPDPACTGPIALRDPEAVRVDIANLQAAARAAGIGNDQLFMSAASPGVIALFLENHYYGSREEYLAALVDAMRDEYRAIVEAGITLQLDCPDFAMSYNTVFQHLSVEEFRHEVALAVEATNAAIAGLSPELVRVHLCWGNLEAPHTHDVPLRDILDIVLRADAAGISIEACNPRHGHEWEVFEEVELPDDRYVIPGVIDTTTNFVEHPELVAQRLDNYARLVGPERVVASTDCGFGTFVGRDRVVESVAWAKLASMVEGARLASERSARRAAAGRSGS